MVFFFKGSQVRHTFRNIRCSLCILKQSQNLRNISRIHPEYTSGKYQEHIYRNTFQMTYTRHILQMYRMHHEPKIDQETSHIQDTLQTHHVPKCARTWHMKILGRLGTCPPSATSILYICISSRSLKVSSPCPRPFPKIPDPTLISSNITSWDAPMVHLREKRIFAVLHRGHTQQLCWLHWAQRICCAPDSPGKSCCSKFGNHCQNHAICLATHQTLHQGYLIRKFMDSPFIKLWNVNEIKRLHTFCN